MFLISICENVVQKDFASLQNGPEAMKIQQNITFHEILTDLRYVSEKKISEKSKKETQKSEKSDASILR